MKWIPTSVSMPSEQGQYLVTFPLCNGEPWVYILSFNKGKFYETDDEWGDVEYDDVTAWMPLPEPYTADTPQTKTQTETQNSNLTFENRTMRDCYNCKRYEAEGECIECNYEPKDEPQTEDWQDWKDKMWAEAIVTEPQTETEIAKAIVHKMIDDAVIAEDAYPDLRQKMHDAVDEYEPQTERSDNERR